jgi:thiamine transport system ATP-binding protein
VTHDQTEAFALADRVAIIHEGRILQIDTPEALWARPVTETVARFLGLDNVLEAEVDGSWARTPIGPVPVTGGAPPGPARIVVRPGAFRPDPQGTVDGRVRGRTFRGDDYLVEIEAGGVTIEATFAAAPRPGSTVRLTVDPEGVSFLEPEERR